MRYLTRLLVSILLFLCFVSNVQAVITEYGNVEINGNWDSWGRCTRVGYDSYGSLTINGGSELESFNSYIGCDGGIGFATVDGAGSTLTNFDDYYGYGRLTVGHSGDGNLNITNGGCVINTYGYIGREAGSSGSVTVDGASWINSTYWEDWYTGAAGYSGSLEVGYSGSGTLEILNGGNVDVQHATWVARNTGSSGSIHFDNGTLNTGSLFAGASQLKGTGTINTHGLIADGFDLVFDATHGLQKSIVLSGQDQNILINLNQQTSGNLGAGYTGDGTVTIQDGLAVESDSGYLGYHAGSNGTISVLGADSTWNCSGFLDVGESGNGELNILDSGKVDAGSIRIGQNFGVTGIVNVSGAGSILNSGSSTIGSGGSGKLNITDGAVVTQSGIARFASEAGSTGTATVGNGSKWILGSSFNYNISLLLGQAGGGILNVTDGGTVEAHGNAFIGHQKDFAPAISSSDSSYGILNLSGNLIVDNETRVAYKTEDLSVINFNGGTLTTKMLLAGSSQMTGTGTINTNSLIVDGADLVFDTPESRKQTFVLNNQGQNITVNLNQQDSYILGAGYTGNGTLTICNGHTITSNLGYIGYGPGSTGTLTVSDAGSTWNNQGELKIGCSGTGLLNVTDGAIVNSSFIGWRGCVIGGKGTVNISGVGSVLNNGDISSIGTYSNCSSFTVGGKLNITDGGTVNSYNSEVYCYKGSVTTVSGAGSTWNAIPNLNSHFNCNGDLNILNGGFLNTSYRGCRVGTQAGATGKIIVSGDDSIWTNSASAYIGYSSDAVGILQVTRGGSVSISSLMHIGQDFGSVGKVSVSGKGTTLTGESYLWVGYRGKAELNIFDGGSAYLNRMEISRDKSAEGKVTVSGKGSELSVDFHVFVGYYGDGELNILDHGLVKVGGRFGTDYYYEDGGSSVNMSTGGMLALLGEADDSLSDFLELVEGTDAIRWWDEAASDWAPLTTATLGSDYTLEYLTEGDLSGYTVLTVGAVPEPSTVAMLAILLAIGVLSACKRHGL